MAARQTHTLEAAGPIPAPAITPLPSGGGGAERSAPRAAKFLPAEPQRRRQVATLLLLRAWDACRARWPGRSARGLIGLFAASPAPDSGGLVAGALSMAQWCAARGLSCRLGALRRYARRLPRDGNADRRGRPVTGLGVECQPDPRLVECFVARAQHQNGFSLAAAWRDARDLAADLALPLPSLRWWQGWFARSHPVWARQFARSPKRFNDRCLPKIVRSYTEVAPLEWISLDGHVLNLRCQAEGASRSGRAIRPVLTGVLDIRSRLFLGWDLRPTENSDGILAGLLSMHRQYGCARHYYTDNGRAYGAALGRRGRRRRRRLFDDERLGQLCAATGAQLHHALPYCGWAKMIESHWRGVVENFEKYWPSWWGSRPAERPDQAHEIPVWDLPTLDQVRSAWADYLTVYHAEPQHGDGMFGASPRTIYEQFAGELRRVDDDVLRFICARLVGERCVQRDGVRLDGRLYGQYQEEVWRWQGRTVQVRCDPSDLSFVWLYHAPTRAVLIATSQRLSGASSEDLRDAQRYRAKLRKLARQYLPARDFLFDSTTGQIMRAKALRAAARQAAARASLPAAPAAQVTIVRSDLAGPVQSALQRGLGRPRSSPPEASEPPSIIEQAAIELFMDTAHFSAARALSDSAAAELSLEEFMRAG